jgi:hypothetical protein
MAPIHIDRSTSLIEIITCGPSHSSLRRRIPREGDTTARMVYFCSFSLPLQHQRHGLMRLNRQVNDRDKSPAEGSSVHPPPSDLRTQRPLWQARERKRKGIPLALSSRNLKRRIINDLVIGCASRLVMIGFAVVGHQYEGYDPTVRVP